MANIINNLSLKTEIEIKGTAVNGGENKKISVDFTDRRFSNRLLRLINRYSKIEDELVAKFEGIDEIEDEIERLLKTSDVEIEVLEDFKSNVNTVFGFDIVGELFGDCLPDIERYFEFFEVLTPYVVEATKKEQERVSAVKSKYSLDRVVKKGGKKSTTKKKPAKTPAPTAEDSDEAV